MAAAGTHGWLAVVFGDMQLFLLHHIATQCAECSTMAYSWRYPKDFSENRFCLNSIEGFSSVGEVSLLEVLFALLTVARVK